MSVGFILYGISPLYQIAGQITTEIIKMHKKMQKMSHIYILFTNSLVTDSFGVLNLSVKSVTIELKI